jgi:hypothetical protein
MGLIRKKIKEVIIMAVNPTSNNVIPSTMATNQNSSKGTGVTSAKPNSTTKPNPPAIVNPSYSPVNTQKPNTNITSKPTYPPIDDTVSISDKANDAYKAANDNKNVNKKDTDDNPKANK